MLPFSFFSYPVINYCLAALQHGLPSISPVTTQFKKSEHPKLLSLVKGKRAYIIPDNEDSQAGMKGAQETQAFLKSNGVEACIIILPRPGGEKIDLNEYLRDQGVEAFNRLVEAAEEAEYIRVEGEAKREEGQGEKPSIGALVCDVSTFLFIEFPPKSTIIEPWLSASTINMIYGPRGIGKTMFALGVLSSAATGESFGPWNVTTPVPCLYLDGEMAQQDTQNRCSRLNSLRNPQRQPFIIYSDAYMNQHGLPRANLLDDDWRKMMKELLLANGIKLWVADNIASLAPGIDENSKQEWDPVNQWFLELRFAGITTIFLHHANKDGGQRGTSGREDNIDISILLDWPNGYTGGDGCKFVAKFQKARLEQKYLHLIADTEFALEVDAEEDYFWTFRNLKAENRKTILEMLDQDVAQKDIAVALGIGAGYVSRVRSQAVKDGHLAKNGKLTQSGFVFVHGA